MFKANPDALAFSISEELPYLILFFILVEWLGRSSQFSIENMKVVPKFVRWSFYFGLILLLFLFAGQEQEFIYFQF